MRRLMALLGISLACGGWIETAEAAFPGANGRVAYLQPGEPGIGIANLDGTGRRQVATGATFGSVAWAPSGRLVVATSRAGLAIVDFDGPTRWISVAPVELGDATFSADGQSILFVGHGAAGSRLYRVASAGGVATPVGTAEPAWSVTASPAGTTAFVESSPPSLPRVTVVGAGGARVGGATGSEWSTFPDFSPDGLRLLFKGGPSEAWGTVEANFARLYTAAADGSGARPLRAADGGALPAVHRAVYLPDGTGLLAFTQHGLETIDLQTGARTHLGLPGDAVTFAAEPVAAASCDVDAPVMVGNAQLAGCVADLGAGRFRLDGEARVGGFTVRPTGTGLVADTRRGRLSGSGQVLLDGMVLPLAASALPTHREGFELALQNRGVFAIRKLPLTGTLRGAWNADGSGASVSVDVDVVRAVAGSGSLDAATGSTSFGGTLVATTTNAGGLELSSTSVTLGSISLVPRILASGRVARVVGVRGATLHYSATDRGDEWSGSATVGLPLARLGTQRTATGRLTFVDGRLAAVGFELDDLNVPLGATPVWLQRGSGHLRLGGAFGLELRAGLSFGPRVLGESLLEGQGSLAVGSLATRCRRSADPFELALSAGGSLAPLERVARTSVAGHACVDLSRELIEASLDASIEFGGGVAGIDGHLAGWASGADGAFQLGGKATLQLPALPDISAEALLSDRGIAACGGAGWATVGVGYRWGDSRPTVFDGCGMRRWQSASAAAAPASRAGDRRRPSATVRVGSGGSRLGFRVAGAAGSPRVRVSGPGGVVYESPADAAAARLDDDVLIVPVAASSETVVLVRRAAAGTWRVEPADPGVELSAVATSRPLPRVQVAARVTRSGSRWLLHYRTTPLPGQVIRFVERGHGVARTVATTARSRGVVRFASAAAPNRSRTIHAEVVQDGLPREVRVVARFRGAGLVAPGTVRRVAVRRAGAGLVRVNWKPAPRARHYLVTVSAGGRVVTRQLVRATAVSAPVGSERRVRVGIRAIGRDGVAGAQVQATARLPPG